MGSFGGTLWGGGTASAGSGSSTAIQVLSLIDEALRYAGITTGPGRTPSDDQRNDALLAMQRLLKGWEARRLRILTIIRSTFTLVASQASYTIGPENCHWTAARPAKIERAGLVVDDFEIPIRVLTEAEWAEIADKTLESQVGSIFYRPTVPYGTIYPYPVSSEADSLALYLWNTMGAIANFNDFVDLAPPYEDAIVFNLALRLWMKNTARSILTVFEVEELKRQAREAMAAVETLNAVPVPRMDPDYTSTDCGYFDTRSGRYLP